MSRPQKVCSFLFPPTRGRFKRAGRRTGERPRIYKLKRRRRKENPCPTTRF
nr:MAG TPA: hypothetical protein [Caudoviricetes sp.]